METELLICGYSYHAEPFYTNFKNGLSNYLFRLQVEGSSEVYARGRHYRMRGGDLLILKPGDEYDLRIEPAEPGGRVASGDYYLFCQGAWIDAWWNCSPRPAVSRIGTDERLLALWRNLLLEKRRGPREESAELSDCLLRALCLYVDRAMTETSRTDRTFFAALRLKRYIEEHATSTFKLEEAAQSVGLSLSRAVHLFKSCYGLTMIQYAIEIRLDAALERMKYSSMSLDQIAETCGFASYSYFHRVFRKKYGVSPARYRNSES
ncbi:AraC family transcriptional regulator [Cohnella sp. CFH 77786]|uniref:AraC family transcriptional regulator n=1 Tax=Cohnella sp. CFH 77786 TaxID=2662265 RepID=UPI001C6080C3|nr:AraC family transcriptional regulator [Cohnella sp. CFH 77786]MBW5445138.1 AraC family transcriptional regulator [Cohnella sp. CFH 77786]